MSNTNSPNDWNQCAPGELTSLGRRLHNEQRRRQTALKLRTALACSVAVIAALGATWWLQNDGPPGGIACAECHSNFGTYHEHLTGGNTLNADLAASMQAHLSACEVCRTKFEEEFPGVLAAAIREAGAIAASRKTHLGLVLARGTLLPLLD